eukprot:1156517-Pelagomonas_calceolata.AAC.4
MRAKQQRELPLCCYGGGGSLDGRGYCGLEGGSDLQRVQALKRLLLVCLSLQPEQLRNVLKRLAVRGAGAQGATSSLESKQRMIQADLEVGDQVGGGNEMQLLMW